MSNVIENHQLTEQQKHALSVAHKGGHTVFAGVPGGAKSTMQLKTFLQLPEETRWKAEMLCYSVTGRESIEAKAGKGKHVRTFDSLTCITYAQYGNLDFKRWRPSRGRHRLFINLLASDYWPEANGQYEPEQLQAMDEMDRVHTIVMATLFHQFRNAEAVLALCEQWGIELAKPDFVTESLPVLMKWTVCGLDEPVDGSYWRIQDGYEFDDLSYVIATNPSIPVRQMKVIIPDELQDATFAQWVCLRRRIGGPAYCPGEPTRVELQGQMVAALDAKQAIYFFRGVLPDMAGRVVAATGATICPLTQSFRLAHALLDRPKRIVAELECFPSNPQGAEIIIDMADVLTLAQPGHVYLSLTNMNCIRMAYFLIRNGIAAVVKGTEIGVDLVRLLDQLAKGKSFSFIELPKALADWTVSQEAFMKARYKQWEPRVDAMRERAASLEYLWEGAMGEGIDTVPAMRERIGQLFSDSTDAHGKAVVCMTVHKCVHPDTLVETPDGLVPIRDIPSAWRIATPMGEKEYHGKFTKASGKALEITTKSGYSITVTPEHGMSTWHEGDVRRDARDLQIGSLLRLRLGCTIDAQLPPSLPQGPNTPQYMSNDLALFFGMMVADGHISKGGIQLAKRYNSVVDKFGSLITELFGLRTHETTIHNTRAVGACSKELTHWLHCVGGMSAHDKFVPDVILRSPLEMQAQFLCGLFEDGTVNNRDGHIDHVHLDNVSHRMLQTVQTMLLRFGIISAVKEHSSKKNRRITTLYIYGQNALRFGHFIGFVADEKNAKMNGTYGPETAYKIPITRAEADACSPFMSVSDLCNARNRGYVSRHVAEKVCGMEKYLRNNHKAQTTTPWLDRLMWHYEPIVSIKEVECETMCVTVPDGERFLQNGFDGFNSKGLEWSVVYLEETDLESQRNGHPYEMMQHRNALYVGLTRMELLRYIIRDSRVIRNKDRML